ncbi:MAG: glycerol kinase GlpK [Bacteroidetes bacterium]|nr:glycerol kinase GlpK [Bacteroidota bacterium]
MGDFILAIDQGTTSSRAMVFAKDGSIKSVAQQEFRQYYPKAGWVEHDPSEILSTQMAVIHEAILKASIKSTDLRAIGITNQRETTVVWEKKSGRPVYPAIVWQDRRTASFCDQLKARGLSEHVKKITGLVIDAYFSGTKVNWILDNVPGARQKAEAGELAFGTIDSWLIWNLSGGKAHVTDYSNASRTMLFDINALQWDEKLLNDLHIPAAMLPRALPSAGHFGDADLDGKLIPIMGVAGDQQAALFGQACFQPGDAKNTYGTGCFMLMNTGTQPKISTNGLITTIAWGLDNKVEYALEGSVFIAGAAIQWLRDGLRMIDQSSDSEYFAKKVKGESDVFVVPAFAGLGAPYWDMYARGAVFGLTRDTGKDHLVKATLESLAYQTKDILTAMEKDAGIHIRSLKVDGGASMNNYLMQFQSDMLGSSVERPANVESTATGAAWLAGVASGLWKKSELSELRKLDKSFNPVMASEKRDRLYSRWLKAVERSKDWAEH